MLASDDANHQFSNARNPDDILHVTFYVKAVKNNFKSEKEGHPVFDQETFIRILIPGRNDLTIDEPVRNSHKMRFPKQWAQFQNSQAPIPVSGTPLEEWPLIERSRAEELKAQRVFTVEQIAEISDFQLQSLGMDGAMLRQKAKAFLERAKGSAFAQEKAAEVERLRQEMEAKDKAHAAEMAELRKLILDGGEKRKPGRPKKVKEGDQPVSV